MATPLLSINHLTKSYGKARGVVDITLNVPKGSVFGFLGPNGAGKTTTISTVVDLIKPNSGKITVFGLDSQQDSLEIRKRIGFLAGDMALDSALTGKQQIEYFAHLRGDYDNVYVSSLTERLNCDLSRRIHTLSRGNRQKVALITALMHKPELLILDEPTSGLDPLIQDQFNQIILDCKAAGRTTFISSHILDEVEEICDYVAFIKDGKIITSDSIYNILASLPQDIRLSQLDNMAIPKIKSFTGVSDLVKIDGTTSFSFCGDIHQLMLMLSTIRFKDIVINRPDLEKIFMKYYR